MCKTHSEFDSRDENDQSFSDDSDAWLAAHWQELAKADPEYERWLDKIEERRIRDLELYVAECERLNKPYF